jgi:hypothetical protein
MSSKTTPKDNEPGTPDLEADLLPPEEGAGRLLQRDYWAIIRDCRYGPRDLARTVRERFWDFPPQELVRFTRADGTTDPLDVGDEMDVEIRMAGTFRVRILHADDNSITIGTIKGHPEAGRITFGCLNIAAKVNPNVLDAWAQILSAVPTSRLLLLGPPGQFRARVLAHLQSKNIDPARIEFTARLARRQYLELYRRIDVALDTFPYNGHTTSLDALYMGVPVVTLSGHKVVSRAGASHLANLDLRDLVAHTSARYQEIATQLAGPHTSGGGRDRRDVFINRDWFIAAIRTWLAAWA